MKKRIFGAALAATAAVFALASCGESAPVEKEPLPCTDGGDLFVVMCWNDEFRAFFNKYLSDEGVKALQDGHVLGDGDDKDPKAKDAYKYQGVATTWRETPSDNGGYQFTLDMMLENQEKSSQKVDMFLAEADYIQKYADSNLTADIAELGVSIDQSKIYNYTKQAATDTRNGKVKGVSFQCCPAGLIYNTKIAQEVLETSDPAEVQEFVKDWAKFDETAAKMKTAKYYMTACCDETYRVFSNNATEAWVKDDVVKVPAEVEKWIEQANTYVQNGYTIVGGVWSGEKTANINTDAAVADYTEKAFCCFGPAWYFNFCMGGAQKGGRWHVVAGPQGWFWGGTWLMAAAGTDNKTLVGKAMNAVLNDATFLDKLTKVEGQFVNNSTVNNANAANEEFKGEFLNQNDAAIWVTMADSIKWENHTIYDQLCNEGITGAMANYFNKKVSKEEALDAFYTDICETYPNLKKPA